MTDERTDRVAASYDRVAAEYMRRVADELVGKPADRALLDAFAAAVAGRGPVLDLGCGPGHVAAYLADRGVDVTGVDLSAAMVAEATARFPAIPFRRGSMVRLTERGTLGGIVAMYSVIHTDRAEQPAMFRTWREALAPGGLVLVAFHTGEADRHVEELFGEPVDLDFLFFPPGEIADRLTDADLDVIERHERDPYPGIEAPTRRCYLLARRGDLPAG